MYPEPDTNYKPEDVGTRLRHLQDLLELWRIGLAIYNSMNPEYINIDRFKQLEAGVEILEKQVDIMTGYDHKAWDLRDAIDRIPRNPEDIPVDKNTAA